MTRIILPRCLLCAIGLALIGVYLLSAREDVRAANTASAQEQTQTRQAADEGDSSGQSEKNAQSTSPRSENKNEKPRRPGSGLPAFSAQREAAALSFVKEHHTELADLLTQLKKQDRREYERAVRDLFRTSERLANERERDEERWQLNLKVWKLESRIRLMAARLAMDPDDESLRTALREALAEQVDTRLERLRLDRRRMEERISRIDTAIERAEKAKQRTVDDSFERLLQSVTSQRSRAKERKDKRE